MKRVFVLLSVLAALLLTACAAESGTDTRIEELQRKYTEMSGCATRVDVTAARADETQRYTLDVESADGETRVTVLEPEALAGVSAVLRGDALELEYDSMVLDVGSADPDVSAANAASIFLRAAAQGYVAERSTERFESMNDALRLCFETERGSGTLLVTAWFDTQDAPLYAEIERDGEILAYLEFTDFAFHDIIPAESGSKGGISDGNAPQAHLGGDRSG